MRPIVTKMLKSGLMDRKTVELLETAGCLPRGSSELVEENALKDATSEQRAALAAELELEAESDDRLHESVLDLYQIQMPCQVVVRKEDGTLVTPELLAMVDVMGRFYFRIQDVNKSWFVPGWFIQHKTAECPNQQDMIIGSRILYTDDQPVCIQVEVER